MAAGSTSTDAEGRFSLTYTPTRSQNGNRYLVRAAEPDALLRSVNLIGTLPRLQVETDFIVLGSSTGLDFMPEAEPITLSAADLPYRIELTAGGILPLNTVAGPCPGFGTDTPHFAFEWTAGEEPALLVARFEPTRPQPVRTLMIAPDGFADCFGTGVAMDGLYRVWVGGATGENFTGTLIIEQLD